MMRRALLAGALALLHAGPASAKGHYTSQRGQGLCHAAVDAVVPAGPTNRWLHRKVTVESHDDPGAWHRNRNGSVDRGCSQINSVHGFAPSCLFDARCNIKAALIVLKRQGRGAWTSPG